MQNHQISEIRKLHLKKYREEEQQFIVEGTKSVLDLMNSKLTVLKIVATAEWLTKFENVISNKIEIIKATMHEMERISCLKNPQEVLAIAETPSYSINQLKKDVPILVLDGISDPGNFGTIIRTADWFGITQIVCSLNTVEFSNPKVIQATMGSFSRIKVFYTDLYNFLKQEKDRNVFGTFLEGEPIQKIKFQNNDIIIIGNEGNGISAEVEQLVTKKIHIPSYAQSTEKAESLNAAISTAILLYQFRN
ncbi:MAG: RNA methyltransferase [Bacteroidales bacterium]|nr:RNA methyltransferase [Bacteroidales bacterium]